MCCFFATGAQVRVDSESRAQSRNEERLPESQPHASNYALPNQWPAIPTHRSMRSTKQIRLLVSNSV